MSHELIPVNNLGDALRPPVSQRNIWDYWAMPEFEPRKSQVVALERMAALPASKRFVLCQIPVGGGKSPIALTYASYLGHGQLGTSYILTPQRILQRQYEESFDQNRILSVYGKANYQCTTALGLDCDTASDLKLKCAACPAKAAFANMAYSPNVVLNYKLALLYSEIFPGYAEESPFPARDLMVFDECHTLESHLVDHRAVTIRKRRCEEVKVRFSVPQTMADALAFVRDEYLPALTSLLMQLSASVDAIKRKYEFEGEPKHTPSELNTIRKHKTITRHTELIRSIAKKDADVLDAHYVLVTDKESFQFKEIYGRNLFQNILEPKADRFLFMSSTILNADEFCRDVGIPRDEMEYIDLTSEFDVDNRPVCLMPTAKMSYGWDKKEPAKDRARAKMVAKVIELCNMHAEDSGIMHTGSFKIAKWIIEEIKDHIPQEIVTHTQDEASARDDIIDYYMEHSATTPMILISPSMTEGLDLKHDLGRFSIFLKVPYPSLADEWVKRRLELSDEWYQRQAMIAIIQGGGRVVRAPDDWGNTYILDESFNYLWFKFKGKTPQWWKDAFVKMK